jgi:polar amino acid transport system ATP-binding protein
MEKYEEKQTILYVDNISVGYDNGKPVIKNINMIEKDVVREGVCTGQVIAVVGRSGRGKSTLFRALTGLSKPSTGNVLITSNESTDQAESAKIVVEGTVGFVDQKYTLFRHKTVYQIMMYALRKSKLAKPEKDKTIDEYLSEWGLVEEKYKYSVELSGGEKQRVAIIEQLLTSKHFIVLDEPAASLDIYAIEKMKESFRRILSSNELNTIIFSTHDLHLAAELADSVYVIGHPEGVTDYSTVIKHFDLKQMGIAWQPYGEQHHNLVNDIKLALLNS